MKYYSQYRSHDLFEFQESLSGLSRLNRWVKLQKRMMSFFDSIETVLPTPQGCVKEIN